MDMFLGGLKLRTDAKLTFVVDDTDIRVEAYPRPDGRWHLSVHAYDENGRPFRWARDLVGGDQIDQRQNGALVSVQVVPHDVGGDVARPGDIMAAVVAYDASGQIAVEMAHDGMRSHRKMRTLVGEVPAG